MGGRFRDTERERSGRVRPSKRARNWDSYPPALMSSLSLSIPARERFRISVQASSSVAMTIARGCFESRYWPMNELNLGTTKGALAISSAARGQGALDEKVDEEEGEEEDAEEDEGEEAEAEEDGGVFIGADPSTTLFPASTSLFPGSTDRVVFCLFVAPCAAVLTGGGGFLGIPNWRVLCIHVLGGHPRCTVGRGIQRKTK
jgi:hypothetical protein